MIAHEKFTQGKFIFDAAFLTDIGARAVNEDYLTVEQNQSSIFMSIADGLGAHGGGDIASKIASDIAKKESMDMNKINANSICEMFRNINEAILEEQTEDIQMKTTMACVLIKGRMMYSAHIGDTRIYTFTKGKKLDITTDHSLAYEEIVKSGGTRDDIRKSPSRHILNAALGTAFARPPDISKRRIKPEMSILICSDGFWEYVNEDEAAEALERTVGAHEWLTAMMEYYNDKADEFKDNYSAICLRIKKLRRKTYGV